MTCAICQERDRALLAGEEALAAMLQPRRCGKCRGTRIVTRYRVSGTYRRNGGGRIRTAAVTFDSPERAALLEDRWRTWGFWDLKVERLDLTCVHCAGIDHRHNRRAYKLVTRDMIGGRA